ncbi:hypothetical protein ACIQWR_34685 [Streptomyces sp. NPDC098789]|uniref:hypothetical protein n=1 Tax=Streptomyces sp. NPDC098789 TaxID=3366098 RepID=UPI00383037C7
MRPAWTREGAHAAPHTPSPTPIFDALYSEYLRSFRALPGDRSGEEDLGFTAFGTAPAAPGGALATTGYPGAYSSGQTSTSGWNGSAWQTDPWQPSYAPQPSYVPQPSYAGQGTQGYATAGTAPGYGNGRQHQTGMQHIPAALPPAPRRGY